MLHTNCHVKDGNSKHLQMLARENVLEVMQSMQFNVSYPMQAQVRKSSLIIKSPSQSLFQDLQ